MTGAPALLCTEYFAEHYHDRLAAAAPDLALVRLVRDVVVPDAELARVDAVFFSADSYPATSAQLLGAGARGAEPALAAHVLGRHRPPDLRAVPRPRACASRPPRAPTPRRSPARSCCTCSRSAATSAACCATRRPTRGTPGRSTTSTARRSAWSAWARSRARSSAWRRALGMHPIGMRRAVLGDEPCETWTLDRLRELAGLADVLAIALPLNDDTRGIVSADVIAAMRPGAVFVNVGRGDLVDEPALVAALASGRLGGAGLDVFATEPLPAESPLWDLPNVIITPHNSANTRLVGRRRGGAVPRQPGALRPRRGAAQRALTPNCPPDPARSGRIPTDRTRRALPTRAPLRYGRHHRHPPGHLGPIGPPTPGRSPVPVTVLWAAKGGSGTTVVTASLALSCPTDSLLVDLAGDLPDRPRPRAPGRPGRRRLAGVGRPTHGARRPRRRRRPHHPPAPPRRAPSTSTRRAGPS